MSAETPAVLRVIDAGFGATIQDWGRPGWRKYGVPPSGCMDFHAAACANNLLENEPSAPVLEILLGRIKCEVLRPAWIAVTGAIRDGRVPAWRAYHAAAGEVIELRQPSSGVWTYLAIEGGLAAPAYFGSASYYARGGIGLRIENGVVLNQQSGRRLALPPAVAGRLASWSDRRDYANPPVLHLWRGPQWKSFSIADREKLLTAEWTVRPESDRVGYRLAGPVLKANPPEIVSEAVRVGSIQVPENGQPIVTMRDGPTVGGYPKIALVDEDDLGWLAQCRSGSAMKFKLMPS
jgi:biotin-dependent carboxylase-like uncharacterized protein